MGDQQARYETNSGPVGTDFPRGPWVGDRRFQRQLPMNLQSCQGVALTIECLSSIGGLPASAPHKPDVVPHTCHPNTREEETGGSEAQGHPRLYNK